MVDLTNDNNEDSPLDSLHPQNLIRQSQGKRKQQTLYFPPTKKSSIQWKTSQIKKFDPAFPAATPMPTMPTQTFVATHSGALAPPLFFQRAPPPTPLTAPSLNPFTAIETRGYNASSLHEQEQQLQGQQANPTPPNPHTLSTQPLKSNIKDWATIRTNIQDTVANVHTIENKIQTVSDGLKTNNTKESKKTKK
jgi:hypothetical protein